jgi:hypothetical protein
MKNLQKLILSCVGAAMIASPLSAQARARARDLGVSPGIFQTGPNNAITDVQGVKVGHATIVRGDSIHTGITAILPHDGNLYFDRVPAAVHIGNAFGKLLGSTQVVELGTVRLASGRRTRRRAARSTRNGAGCIDQSCRRRNERWRSQRNSKQTSHCGRCAYGPRVRVGRPCN